MVATMKLLLDVVVFIVRGERRNVYQVARLSLGSSSYKGMDPRMGYSRSSHVGTGIMSATMPCRNGGPGC